MMLRQASVGRSSETCIGVRVEVSLYTIKPLTMSASKDGELNSVGDVRAFTVGLVVKGGIGDSILEEGFGLRSNKEGAEVSHQGQDVSSESVWLEKVQDPIDVDISSRWGREHDLKISALPDMAWATTMHSSEGVRAVVSPSASDLVARTQGYWRPGRGGGRSPQRCPVTVFGPRSGWGLG